jgi:hypothetical protein
VAKLGPDPTAPAPDAGAEQRARAEALVDAFYRGLGVGTGTLTRSILARERSIARQLMAAGTTPAEAEAYAREMASVPHRLAPIDLRGFERERSTWTARRSQASTGSRRYVDRTGQGIVEEPTGVPTAVGLARAEIAVPSSSQAPPTAARPLTSDHRKGDAPPARLGGPADWTSGLRRRLQGTE